MYKKFVFLLLLFFSFNLIGFAQEDIYAGNWIFENSKQNKSAPLTISFAIANPYAEVLYPALLKINYQNATISYQLLLVKNQAGQLVMGQNKLAAAEFPFILEKPTTLFSGTLTTSTGGGNAFLNLKTKSPQEVSFIPIEGMDSLALISADLNKLLAKESFKFKKINKQPWNSPTLTEIIQPANIGNYYGIIDSLFTDDNNLSVKILAPQTNDKKFSASLNNQYLFEKEAPKFFKNTFKKLLKEGPNLVCFFADDFPLAAKDSAALLLNFGTQTYQLNFAENKNKQAGYIIAIINYEPIKKEKPKEFILNEAKDELLRNTLLIDSLFTHQQELTLAIWDDALQDGDSISLSVNGKWILQNKLVTNLPQFFKITVQPGVNNMVFVANNLGRIPPNTSIIEIIDAKQRKAFNISTNLRQNNLVKIIYEVSK